MARTNKPSADDKTVEGIAHDHGDGDAHHVHRLGDLPHLHDEHGKAILLNEHGKPLFDQAETPDPAPGGHHADVFNGEAQAKAAERRAAVIASVTDADIADMERIRRERTDAILPRRRVDPAAAREEVMRAAMSTYTQASQEGHALVHSLEATRLMELAGVIGEMFATNGNGDLVDVDHIREAKRLVRLLADTRGVDPLAGEAGL